jgi:hypothetical protein
MQSIYNHLIHKYSKDPSFLKKCILVWSVKDEIFISNFQDTLSKITDVMHKFDSTMNASYSANSVDGHFNTKSLNGQFGSTCVSESFMENSVKMNENRKQKDMIYNPYGGSNPFTNEFYVTNGCIDGYTNTSEYSVQYGRPNFPSIIEGCSLFYHDSIITITEIITFIIF